MFIPSKRIREAVISQALSPRGQAFLRACNGKTIVEDEHGRDRRRACGHDRTGPQSGVWRARTSV